MTLFVDLPADVRRRLEAEATRRGETVGAVIAELVADLPDDTEMADDVTPRSELAILAVGASGGTRGRAADADDLLADGFGLD